MGNRLSKRFWDRWYKADETKRTAIVSELNIEKACIGNYALASLINSFFEDLADYLKKQYTVKQEVKCRR